MDKYRLPHLPVVDRVKWILDLASKRSCLHVGCADAPYYESQFGQDRLLHAKLNSVVARLVGVDLSVDGVEFLHSVGFGNVLVGDIENLGSLLKGELFDVIVAGEIVEHLGNPVLALTELKRHLYPNGSILITVPNAFSLKSFLRVLVGRELVHPDHLYYFSKVTIEALLARSGLRVVEVCPYISSTERCAMRLPWLLVRFIARMSPWISDGLVIRAST
jgi:SAM-dependent methyltransferase